MLDCWNLNPTLRPSFTDLAGRFGVLLQHSTKSVCDVFYHSMLMFGKINNIELPFVELCRFKQSLCEYEW